MDLPWALFVAGTTLLLVGLVVLLVGRRHRRFMVRWTFEVEHDEDSDERE